MSEVIAAGPPANRCADCGTELAPSLVSCPACHRLVHADELKQLAAAAEQATASGDTVAALGAWRSALVLLPPGSRQFDAIRVRIDALSREVDAGTTSRPSWIRRAGPIGVALLLLWKAKALVAFVLTKGKLLLVGLTKAPTAFSMILSLGVYWAAWGWAFAAGLIVSLYIHEMGHVAALQRFGIKATAPMFVPGLGAFVRMDQYPNNPMEDARVGLAGPIWGLGAALLALLVHVATGSAYWAAIAKFGALLNLFNLIPLWQLDGGRGFRALSRPQRVAAAGSLIAAWWWSGEGLIALLALAGVGRAALGRAPEAGDTVALVQYAGLVAGLTLIATVNVALP